MKKLLSFLILVSASVVHAGEAVIPFWQANDTTTYTINVSNVSSTDAEVEIVLFNKGGSKYTGSYISDNGGTLNTPFILPANETVWIWIEEPSGTTIATTHRGYGTIKSTEANNATGKTFLVAYGKYNGTNSSRWMAVPVNGGMPF